MLLSSLPEEIGARTLWKPEVVLYINGQLCFSLSVLFFRNNNEGRLQSVLRLSSTNASLNMLPALSSSHDGIWVGYLIHFYLMLPDLLCLLLLLTIFINYLFPVFWGEFPVTQYRNFIIIHAKSFMVGVNFCVSFVLVGSPVISSTKGV